MTRANKTKCDEIDQQIVRLVLSLQDLIKERAKLDKKGTEKFIDGIRDNLLTCARAGAKEQNL